MARTLVTSLGAPNLRIIEVEHPLGGLRDPQVLTRASAVAGEVLAALDMAALD
ncbi:MAG TPA: hypothetical protein VF223_15425 [Trebonia sp.]